jgi:hypothetical protein
LGAVSNRDDWTDVDSDRPLDLVHLARRCLGDCELEDELLRLFRAQSQALTAQLSDPPQLSLESKANIAHKLRGSALAVGAWRVADAALEIEELAAAGGDRGRLEMDDHIAEAGALLALVFAVTEAIVEIDRIRG